MILTDVLRLERKLIFVDLETTGKNPKEARIVEVSLEIFEPVADGSVSYRTWSGLVNPGVSIPEDAKAKHGISDEDVADKPTFDQYAPNFAKGFSGCDFGGFSVRYDVQVLQCEFKRAGIAWDYEGAALIDAYRLWQVLFPRTLDDADREFLTPEDRAAVGDGQSHRAEYDIKRSSLVVMRQLLRDEKVPRTPAAIHDLLNPGQYDAEGKLVRLPSGELAINFGQHRDKPLGKVDGGYLMWMRDKADFSRKVKEAVSAELLRRHGLRS